MRKKKEILKNLPTPEYIAEQPTPTNFIKEGFRYDTTKAEIICVYTINDQIPDRLFVMRDLKRSLDNAGAIHQKNAKVVLFKTSSDRWFAVFYKENEIIDHSVVPKDFVAEIFKRNDDSERYEKYIGTIAEA